MEGGHQAGRLETAATHGRQLQMMVGVGVAMLSGEENMKLRKAFISLWGKVNQGPVKEEIGRNDGDG